MRKIHILFILGLLISCSQADNEQVFRNYIDAYYHHGFEDISEFLADTVTIADIDDYQKIYSKEEFRVFYQWDSVFKPDYKLISLTSTDSIVDVIQTVSSERLVFLGNNPLKTRKRVYFNNGLITRIENQEYLNVDWEVWIARRDSLVKWVDLNHPELNGFIYDMTKEGAEDYQKAMELFRCGGLSGL